MMVQRVLLSLLLSLIPIHTFGQGITPVSPVNGAGSRLFPSAFSSADNIAAQTATFMHGGLMAWDSGGSNWDRLLLTSGALHVNLQNASIAVTQSGTWNIGSITTLPALSAGANTIGAVTLAQYTPVTGRLPVDGSGVTQPVSGTVTANQGGTWNINSVATLPALPSNQSVNVSQINGVTPLMGNGVTGTGSPRVTIASDNAAFTVNAAQSGTWTVQPGNTQNTTPWLTQPQGNVAHDAVDSGNPTKIGCHARQTNRTAVADADRADVVCDDNGQLVVTPVAPRDRVVRSGVVTISTMTETTLIAAGGAGVFRDLTYLKCTNNSATLVRVDLRDATAGTVIDSWALAASGGGFNLAFSVPYAQAAANNNWTVQLSGAVTDVRCSAQAVEKN